MLNVVALMGRLVADPELRHTPQGVSVTTFTIAVDRSFVRQGEHRQADFIDIVAWRSSAEFVCRYFQKGSLIAVDGNIQTRNYQDKNGNNRKAVEIVANNINFAGSKSSSNGNNGGDYSSAHPGYTHDASAVDAVSTYSAGNNDDFTSIEEYEDLPF